MAGGLQGIKARIEGLRAGHPHVDRLVRTQEHYGAVQASQQAGAATYFGFLSVFPILALAYFVVGQVSRIYPGAHDTLNSVINTVLPGLVGDQPGQISLTDIENSANAVGLIGLLGVLYTGLGWLSSLRSALLTVFCVPAPDQPSFVAGKLRDLVTLVVLGVVLFVAVAISGLIAGFSAQLLTWLGASRSLEALVWVLSLLIGLAVNSVLFFAMFVLLAEPQVRRRDLWAGAVLGGVGFEVLKQISGALLKATQGKPAFQVFGTSLILLLWINYFSRVTLYAAAYAYVAPRWRLAVSPAASSEPAPSPAPAGSAGASLQPAAPVVAPRPRVSAVPAFVAGALSAGIGLVLLRARRRPGRRPAMHPRHGVRRGRE